VFDVSKLLNKYYVLTSKNKYNVLIVFRLYCKTLLLLRCDMGKGSKYKYNVKTCIYAH